MTIDSLKQNIMRIKETTRELYVFTNQFQTINAIESRSGVVIKSEEKKLLTDVIESLVNQIKILNDSIPSLIDSIGFYKKLITEENAPEIRRIQGDLVQIKYKPSEEQDKIAVTISGGDRKRFLENLSMSNLSINKLKNKYAVEKPVTGFGKPSVYAKLSNRFFKEISNYLLTKGYLGSLNDDLRVFEIDEKTKVLKTQTIKLVDDKDFFEE